MRKLRVLIVLGALLFMVGCAGLISVIKTPTVTVENFDVIPGNSIVPTFEVGLHISNPNSIALKLIGISYQIELEGHDVFSGVSNDLPVIAAYGSGDITLQGKPDLLGTFNLFQDLMLKPREKVSFQVDVILDIGRLLPKIRVSREGQVRLR